jgi:hypothetical protein
MGDIVSAFQLDFILKKIDCFSKIFVLEKRDLNQVILSLLLKDF